MENLTFVVLERGQVSRERGYHFALVKDNWDDFGHQVQFELRYAVGVGKSVRLGSVKILQRTSAADQRVEVAKRTVLPPVFDHLGPEFISLGQDDDYYNELHKLEGVDAAQVLEALRDIAWSPAYAADFEPTSAFRNALTRENVARRARRLGRSLATGQSIVEKPSFTYVGKIEGATEDVEVDFRFDGSDPVPGRIVGIIGRNAVGKTRFLASLGADLAQIRQSSAESLKDAENRFPKGRPLFTRIIAISYSAFDQFKRPQPDQSSSYVYCGIRSPKGGLSRQAMVDTYRANLARIREQGLDSDWTKYMQQILGDSSDKLTDNLQAEIHEPDIESDELSLLSSGQSILTYFVTGLMAWIQPNSLVLFDEPETHLHPNAVASLFLVLSRVLEQFDSYAVVATHSPLVIQEIPAKRVLTFTRVGDVTVAEPLQLESFGESVTELTRHVFETMDVQSVYRETLATLAREEPVEAVMAHFKKGLSLNAQAFLLAQYGKKAGAAK